MARRRANGEGTVFERRDRPGSWVGAVSLGGRRVFVYGSRQSEVLRKLTELRGRTAIAPRATAHRMTVGRYLEGWIDTRVGLRPRTRAGYADIIRLHLVPILGDTALARLSGPMVEQMMRGMVDNGLSALTARHARAVLRRALRDAIAEGLLTRNPAVGIDLPRLTAFEARPLTKEELRAFLAVLNDADRPLFTLLAFTGLRISEALGLRWDDVDLDAAELHVRNTLGRDDDQWVLVPPKTERSRRVVPLVAPVVEALRTVPHVDGGPIPGLVFVTPSGEPIWRKRVTDRFHAALTVTGVTRRVRVHDLRHGAATILLGDGVPVRVVSDILGHSTVATTLNIYGAAIPGAHRDAVERLAAIVGGAG